MKEQLLNPVWGFVLFALGMLLVMAMGKPPEDVSDYTIGHWISFGVTVVGIGQLMTSLGRGLRRR